jgi:hypothetical protein
VEWHSLFLAISENAGGAQLWSSTARLSRKNLSIRKPTDPTRSRSFDFVYENTGMEISGEIRTCNRACSKSGKPTFFDIASAIIGSAARDADFRRISQSFSPRLLRMPRRRAGEGPGRRYRPSYDALGWHAYRMREIKLFQPCELEIGTVQVPCELRPLFLPTRFSCSLFLSDATGSHSAGSAFSSLEIPRFTHSRRVAAKVRRTARAPVKTANGGSSRRPLNDAKRSSRTSSIRSIRRLVD